MVIQPVSANRPAAVEASLSTLLARKMEESMVETVPFYCHGFVYVQVPSRAKSTDSYVCGSRFDGKLVYLSDISYIPGKTWTTMIRAIEPSTSASREPPTNDTIGPDKLPFPPTAASLSKGHLACLILDCLRLEPHVSHLSFCQALSITQRLSARETYFVGFTHPASHGEWEAACREVEGTRREGEEEAFVGAVGKSAAKQGEAMQRVWQEARSDWKGFVRPGFDGQVIEID